MEQMHISVFTDPSLIGQLDTFLEKYEFYRIIFCPDQPNKIWKPRTERICRFCKQKHPETTFRTDAHHIPEFLGNKYLIFQEECDQCNSKFSGYESNLSAYLGVGLTIFSMKGKKNKIPKFRANDGLTAQQEEIYGIDAIVMEKAGENVVKMDVESGKCEIEFTKASYVPLKAYKALLKIAASSLSDDDIKDYDILIRALAGEEFDEPLSQMATVKEYWLPIKFESPRVYIFKIKSFTETLPRHICMLYFGNQAYQFVIPANANDAYMHKEMSITPLFCPPFYHQKVANINVHEKFVPLGSREKTVGEKGVFHFESDPEILKNLTAYDPVTKKMVDRPFDSDQIVKLIIGKMDDELDLPIEPD